MHLGQGFLPGNYPDLPESAAGDAFSAGEIDPDLMKSFCRDDFRWGK